MIIERGKSAKKLENTMFFAAKLTQRGFETSVSKHERIMWHYAQKCEKKKLKLGKVTNDTIDFRKNL